MRPRSLKHFRPLDRETLTLECQLQRRKVYFPFVKSVHLCLRAGKDQDKYPFDLLVHKTHRTSQGKTSHGELADISFTGLQDVF